jgi:hypothetical protein
MVVVLLFNTLDGQPTIRQILLKGLKFVGTLIASLLLYMGIARLVAYLKGGSLNTYMGIGEMGSLSFADIPRLIGEAYAGVFRFFFTKGDLSMWYLNIHHSLVALMFVVAFILSGLLLVWWCVKTQLYRDGKRLLLLLALLLLFPLGCNIVFVMAGEMRHLLMLYGLVLVLIFPVAVVARYHVAPHKAHNIVCWLIVVAMVCGIWNYAVLANKAYLKMKIGYEQAFAQSASLVTHIQNLAGYSHDKEIILVGLPYRNMNVQRTALADFDDFEIIGVHGRRLFGEIYTYHAYLKNYLGLRQRISLNREENIAEAEVAAVLLAMPQYPDPGSLIIIDDKIYVKFSYDPSNPPEKLFY